MTQNSTLSGRIITVYLSSQIDYKFNNLYTLSSFSFPLTIFLFLTRCVHTSILNPEVVISGMFSLLGDRVDIAVSGAAV